VIKTLTPATSTYLMDPAEAISRLGIVSESSEASAATRLVERCSAVLAGELGFNPWYRELEERFEGCLSHDLDLSARPFTLLVSVQASNDEEPLVEDTDFRVIPSDRDSGEVRLWRPCGWSAPFSAGWAAQWVVQYWAGWWAPGATGDRPDDAISLPLDIQEACWSMVAWRWSSDAADPTIKSESKGGIRLEYNSLSPGQVLTPDAMGIVQRYRPIAM